MNEKANCVICWQVLGSKKQLLHGMKCLKHEVREKLKLFLHPSDFKTLYNKTFFPEPRICNLCFVTIKQIPRGIGKMRDLFGVNVNIKLYKPDRKEWNAHDDSDSPGRSLERNTFVSDSHGSSSDAILKVQKLSLKQTKGCRKVTQRSGHKVTHHSSHSATQLTALTNELIPLRKSKLRDHCRSSSPTSEQAENTEETEYKSDKKNTEKDFSLEHSVDSVDVEGSEVRFQHVKLLKAEKTSVAEKSFPNHNESTNASAQICQTLAVPPAISSQVIDSGHNNQLLMGTRDSLELILPEDLNPSVATQKRVREKILTRSIVNNCQMNNIRNLTRTRRAQKYRKHDHMKSKEQMPAHGSQGYNHDKRDRSKVDEVSDQTLGPDSVCGPRKTLFRKSKELVEKRSKTSGRTENSRSRSTKSKTRSNAKVKGKKNKRVVKHLQQEEQTEVTNSDCRVVEKIVSKVDTTVNISKASQEKVQQLTEQTFTTIAELTDQKSFHSKNTTFCCELCCQQFTSKSRLTNHQRKMHYTGKRGCYRCTFEGCNCTFMKKEKYELHLCTHSSECVLFCEKCGKQFGCQRYLDVHYKVHEKNARNALQPPERTVACEVSGCDKKFTCRVYMKRHVISYHMGRRPQPIPGIFFACKVEGCSKKFSLKSTLCRHIHLVHKKGDYKLNRTVVRYPCTYESCGKEFNRKNLLEEHMVTEHGNMPENLLSQHGQEVDFTERMCEYCGVVLMSAQMPRHENSCLNSESTKSTEESTGYTCQECDMEFGTWDDRKLHVQSHIENPPYKCEVEGCRKTFFLQKNLDNHLWNHSKKVSTCDFEGCSQAFDDQLQLAKHSKVHFDGKMKCPWRNCGNCFTSMGTLKQHFLAHSRSLKASFGWDFMCNKCDRVFSSDKGLKKHKLSHEEKTAEQLVNPKRTMFVCEEPGCETKFDQHKEFFDHFLHHYTNTPTACDYEGCTEIFPTMLLQSKHGKSHGNTYLCPWQDCKKTFASSFFQVKKHIYKHLLTIPAIAAGKSHVCSHCNMAFRLQTNLTNHVAQHPEKSEYVCTVCGKKFHHNHLKRHMLTHRQEKPHACSHCGVRYSTVNGLKFHILQTHKIGIWPFRCSYCGKGFISSTELNRHLPSHTKEKPFSCELCGLTFATNTGLKSHRRKHTGEKYVCDVEGCGKVYNTPLSMRGHKAEHAGFSKTCSHCGRTYKNPYGHKCKASRDAKQKGSSQLGHVSKPLTTEPVPIPSPQSAVTSVQDTVAITPMVTTHETSIQQAERSITVPNSVQHIHLMPSSVTSTTHGLSQDMPHVLPHVASNHIMMQDRVQPVSTDITGGTSVNMTGEYTFSNYVVFWNTQNLSHL